MPYVGEWRRPYEVNQLSRLLPVLLLFIVVLFCFNRAPFAFGLKTDWWLVLVNPVFDLFFVAVLLVHWAGARSGVYLSDAGVMVRMEFRRIVVPWRDIAYAEVAEVPKFPVIWQRGPSLGLVLVAPSGQRRPLPARLSAVTLRWGRGSASYVMLAQEQMTQVVNRINELAAGQRTAPGSLSWPSGGTISSAPE